MRSFSESQLVKVFVVSTCLILFLVCFVPKSDVVTDIYLSMPWVSSAEISEQLFRKGRFQYSIVDRARRLIIRLNESGQERKAIQTLVELIQWETRGIGFESETVRESFLLFGFLDKTGKIPSAEWVELCKPVESLLGEMVAHRDKGMVTRTWHVQQQYAKGYENHRVWNLSEFWLVSASENAKAVEGSQSTVFFDSRYLLAKDYVLAKNKQKAIDIISEIHIPTECKDPGFRLLQQNIVALTNTLR